MQCACPLTVRAAFVLVLVTVAFAWPTIAVADRADATLRWQAPAPCPSARDVRARVEQRIGGPLLLRGIEVVVARQAGRRGRYVARVDARAASLATGVRTVSSARCEALADAVAVIVARLASEHALAPDLAPVTVTDAGEPDDLPVQVLDSRSHAVATSRVATADPDRGTDDDPTRRSVRASDATTACPPGGERCAPSPSPSWGLGLHAMALSGIGTVPRVGVGGELSVFARRQRYFVELGFARWSTESAYLVAGAPGRVEVGLDVLTIRAGWSPIGKPIRAWLGGEVGEMRGSGEGLADPMAGNALWTAVTAGVGVGWPMTPNARIIGTFEVAVPISDVTFSLAQGSNIYSASPVAARCALGLELGWP